MKRFYSVLGGLSLLFVIAYFLQPTRPPEDLDSLIRQLAEESSRFRAALEGTTDHSKFDGTPKKEQLVMHVSDFEQAIGDLIESRARGENSGLIVENLLGRAETIDKSLVKYSFGPGMTSRWRTAKVTLLRIAKIQSDNSRVKAEAPRTITIFPPRRSALYHHHLHVRRGKRQNVQSVQVSQSSTRRLIRTVQCPLTMFG